jgi:D-arabinose 1-dehydrogenase-like Zn-dependent alcohol dehydrogenase
MQEVLRNQKLLGKVQFFWPRVDILNVGFLGSTMGSRQDLIDATNFLAEHRIAPIISHVFDGLESAEKGFETMKQGEQFGKIVIRIHKEESTGVKAKL